MTTSQPDLNAAFLLHPDGLVLTNAREQITAINPAAVGLLGIDSDAWLQQPFAALSQMLTLPELTVPGKATWWHGHQRIYIRACTATTTPGGELYVFTAESFESYQLHEGIRILNFELRVPITSIQGFTDLLLRELLGPLSDKQHDVLGHVKRMAMRLTTYVNQINLLNRLYFWRDQRGSQPFALNMLLEDLRLSLKRRCSEKQLICSVDRPEPDITLSCSEYDMRVILTQLLDNAVSYTPTGGSVALRVRSGAGQVLIDVEDSGVGIASEHHDTVFQPYRFINQEYERPERGLGVGLYIARGLAERNGGTLTLRSSLGAGSTFTLALPC